MNPAEILKLCRLVKAVCPSQAIDTYTPEAWLVVLGGIRHEDAMEAVKNLASLPLEPGRSRYIEPGHIIAEVGRIRGKRIESRTLPEPPDGLTPAGYLDWVRDTRDAIASGQQPVERPAIESHANRPRIDAAVAVIAGSVERPAPDAERRREIDDAAAEVERARQLAALDRLTKEATP